MFHNFYFSSVLQVGGIEILALSLFCFFFQLREVGFSLDMQDFQIMQTSKSCSQSRESMAKLPLPPTFPETQSHQTADKISNICWHPWVYEDCFIYPLILTMLLTTFTYKAPVLGAITLVQHQKKPTSAWDSLAMAIGSGHGRADLCGLGRNVFLLVEAWAKKQV